MLIWKVIAANPGITRAAIWERVEHSIPEGYAMRLWVSHRARKYQATDDAGYLKAARRGLLSKALWTMVDLGSLTCEGNGQDRRYTVAREPGYKGNVDAVDETGTKAAEHMAVADAVRRVERLLAAPSAVQKYGRKNCEAMTVLVKTLRTKDRSG